MKMRNMLVLSLWCRVAFLWLVPLCAIAGSVGVLDGQSDSSAFEGGTTNLPAYGWTEVSGEARVFDSGNAGLIHATTSAAPYTVSFDTGVAISPNREYHLRCDTGFFTTEGAAGNGGSYAIELGTLSGESFTALAQDAGTNVWRRHLGAGPSGLGYVSYVSGATVSGDNLAVRLARTGGTGNWFGFDNVKLQYVRELSGTVIIIK